MAHIAGLVAAGEHMSPIPYADVVTTTTHKTLRGPRGGMILASKESADKFNFNKAIFPGTQGGPLEHVIAAKAVCLGEALKPEFTEYQKQVRKNAKALAAALVERGFKLLTGGTDNHLMLVDLRGMDISGKELQNRCDEVFITLNKNTVPNEPRSPFGNLRRPYRNPGRYHPRLKGRGYAEDCRVHLAGSNRFREQGRLHPRRSNQAVREISAVRIG